MLDAWLSIASDSISAADRLNADLLEVFNLLAQFPQPGRSRPELGSGIRSRPVQSYIVFYRDTPSQLQIVRVLHGARDITIEMFDD